MKKTKNASRASVRWNELKKLNQLKEQEHPDVYDSYYSDDYYNLLESYKAEYLEEVSY